MVDARGIGGEGQGSVTYIKGLYNVILEKYSHLYDCFFAGQNYEAIQQSFPSITSDNFIPVKSKSKLYQFAFEFPRLIEEYQIDYAHFQYVTPFVKNCKFIITTHDILFNDYPEEFSWWYRANRNFFYKRSMKRGDILLTVSEYSKSCIVRDYGFDPLDIFVIPNGVKGDFLEKYDKRKAVNKIKEKYGIDNYILCVNRIESRKNHQMLIDAYDELKLAEQDIQMVFIGNNTLNTKELTESIENLKAKYPKHFHWFKFIEDDDLMDFYRAARLFVYPSKAEGFGIPPIEAAAMRINTMCAENTAMADFEFFGDNLFNAYDLEEFELKLLKNLNNPPHQIDLDEISWVISQRYSWETGADFLHHLIQSEVYSSKTTMMPSAVVSG